MELELRERATVDQQRAVLAGAADVGLVRSPIDDDGELRVQTVLRERTVAALPARDPLTALRRVPLRRLAAQPLVLFPREQAPGFHDLLMGALGGAPRVIEYAPEMLTINRPGRRRHQRVPWYPRQSTGWRWTATPTRGRRAAVRADRDHPGRRRFGAGARVRVRGD